MEPGGRPGSTEPLRMPHTGRSVQRRARRSLGCPPNPRTSGRLGNGTSRALGSGSSRRAGAGSRRPAGAGATWEAIAAQQASILRSRCVSRHGRARRQGSDESRVRVPPARGASSASRPCASEPTAPGTERPRPRDPLTVTPLPRVPWQTAARSSLSQRSSRARVAGSWNHATRAGRAAPAQSRAAAPGRNPVKFPPGLWAAAGWRRVPGRGVPRGGAPTLCQPRHSILLIPPRPPHAPSQHRRANGLQRSEGRARGHRPEGQAGGIQGLAWRSPHPHPSPDTVAPGREGAGEAALSLADPGGASSKRRCQRLL